MLLDSRVQWVVIVFEAMVDEIDGFTVTPYIVDPTKASLGG